MRASSILTGLFLAGLILAGLILAVAFGALGSSTTAWAQSAKPIEFCGGKPASLLTFDGGAYTVYAEWAEGPHKSPKESILRMAWVNTRTQAPANAPGDVTVTLRMPSMPHGAGPTKVIQALDEKGQPIEGLYDVRDIFFFMNGKWHVRVHLKQKDKPLETQIIELTIGEEHHDGDGHDHGKGHSK
jgi:hypothetical protein